jgi:hypothetical protein
MKQLFLKHWGFRMDYIVYPFIIFKTPHLKNVFFSCCRDVVGRRSPPSCRSTSPPLPPPTWAPSGCHAHHSTPSLASTPIPPLVSLLSYLQYFFIVKRKILYFVTCSIVDPIGFETFSRIRMRIPKKLFWIRAAPDPKWIWSKTIVKTDKIWQFLYKNA